MSMGVRCPQIYDVNATAAVCLSQLYENHHHHPPLPPVVGTCLCRHWPRFEPAQHLHNALEIEDTEGETH